LFACDKEAKDGSADSAQDVGEQAGIEQQRAKVQTCWRGEHGIQGLSWDDGVQYQNEQRKESKTQRHRRVERKFQFRFSSLISQRCNLLHFILFVNAYQMFQY